MFWQYLVRNANLAWMPGKFVLAVILFIQAADHFVGAFLRFLDDFAAYLQVTIESVRILD
jgi:hypothetical protein